MPENKNGVDSGDGVTPQNNDSECLNNTNLSGNCQGVIGQLKDCLPSILSCTALKKESPNSFCGPCIGCGGRDRFVYKTDTGKCWCRKCHPEPMDVIDFHTWRTGKNTKELIKEYLPANNPSPQQKTPAPTLQKKEPIKPVNPSAGIWANILKKNTNEDEVNKFFANRGISAATAKRIYNEGKCRFVKRDTMISVAVPYKTIAGKVLAIQDLTVNGKPFPHFNGKNKVFNKGGKPGEPCFFSDGKHIDDADIIVVLESVTDAIAGAEAYPGACWLALGSSNNIKKVKVLRAYRDQGKKIVCAFDKDDAGEIATKKVGDLLGVKTHSIRWPKTYPDKHDINDLLKAGESQTIIDLIETAEPVRDIFPKEITPEPPPGVFDDQSEQVPQSDLLMMIKGEDQLRVQTRRSWIAIIDKNDPPVIFEGPNGVVSISKKNRESKEHFIKEVTSNIIRNRLSHVSDWYEKKGKDERLEPIPPLSFVCEDMLIEIPPALPYIKRIVNYPVFTENGDLHLKPGYSEKSQCYLELNGLKLPEIPDNPTPEDTKNARIKIYSLINDFPFTSISERAHAIALMILPFVREMIDGPTPVHLVEASTAGTGKTLLVEALTSMSLGKSSPAMTEGRSDEEWRKRITSKLIHDPPFIFVDNVRRKIDSAALAAVTTIFPCWEDRELGKSKILNLPVNCAFVITGNNPTLSSEMTRRTIRIRMDAGMDHPGRRTKDQFKHPELLEWVKENRGSLVHAILTMVKAWICQGKPKSDIRIGSFEEWSDVIGGILKVGGIPGFLENLDDFYNDADAEANSFKNLLVSWYQEYGVKTKYSTNSIGVAELYTMVINNDIPVNIGDKSERSQRTKLGQVLRQLKDRRFEIETEPATKTEPAIKKTLQVKAGVISHNAQQWELLDIGGEPQNIGYPIGYPLESVEIIRKGEPGEPGEPKTRSHTHIGETEKDPHNVHVGADRDRVKGSPGYPGSQIVDETGSYKGEPIGEPQSIGSPGSPDTSKSQSCETCKCAASDGKCYHYSYAGKSGKPLSCQVAFASCPGYMEKSNGQEAEY